MAVKPKRKYRVSYTEGDLGFNRDFCAQAKGVAFKYAIHRAVDLPEGAVKIGLYNSVPAAEADQEADHFSDRRWWRLTRSWDVFPDGAVFP